MHLPTLNNTISSDRDSKNGFCPLLRLLLAASDPTRTEERRVKKLSQKTGHRFIVCQGDVSLYLYARVKYLSISTPE